MNEHAPGTHGVRPGDLGRWRMLVRRSSAC
jgi:hypothetical protein